MKELFVAKFRFEKMIVKWKNLTRVGKAIYGPHYQPASQGS